MLTLASLRAWALPALTRSGPPCVAAFWSEPWRVKNVATGPGSWRERDKPGSNRHSPSLDSKKITDNEDVKRWVDKYLGVGEWVMDQSVSVFGSSSYFERRR